MPGVYRGRRGYKMPGVYRKEVYLLISELEGQGSLGDVSKKKVLVETTASPTPQTRYTGNCWDHYSMNTLHLACS